jgi:hypothetical protein
MEICSEWKCHLFHLIANEVLCRKRKANMLKMVARIIVRGIVCKSTGLIMHGVIPPPSHMPLWCARVQLNVTFIRLNNIVIVHTCYFYDFVSLHLLWTWNVFVSLLYMTLFDMVLYCLTYQLLSWINFVDGVTETNGHQERESCGWFSRGRRGFSQKQGQK